MDVETVAKDGKFFIAKKNDTLEVTVIGVVGFDFNSKELANKLSENKDVKEVVVKINSPGGDAFEGITIYNLLREVDAKVTVEILGAAFSAASIIAMAGDTVKMAKNAMFMIHNPFTGAHGDAEKLRKTAETLDQLTDNLANIYHAKSGIDIKRLKTMMDDETWLDAAQALKQGFVDEIVDTSKNEVFFNLSEFNFKKTPSEYIKSEFSTEPYEWDFKSLPEMNNVNALRVGVAVTGDSGYVEKYNKFKKEQPKYNKKIELKIGAHIYPLSEKEVAMINQFVKLSGKDNPEDALAYFKDLQEREPEIKVEYKADPDIQNVLAAQSEKIDLFKAELESKQKVIAELTATVNDATEFIKNSKKEKRQAELRRLLEDGYMNAAQLELAEATYYDMPDEVYEAKVNYIKAGGAVFKSLQETHGSSEDGKIKSPVDEIEEAINKYASENDVDYHTAYMALLDSNPELFRKYNESEGE